MNSTRDVELSIAEHATPRRSRHRFGMALILLLSACYLLPLTQVFYSFPDDGTLLYGAQRVSQGAIPGKDFVEVIGPGAFYWLGLFFKIFGAGWQVSRAQLFATSLTTIVLLYDIARQVCTESAAVLLWLFVLVMGVPIWPSISHHWDSNLFAALALWSYLRLEIIGNNGWAFSAGAFAGVASLFIWPKGLFMLASFFLSALLRRQMSARRSWTSLAIAVLGYAAVLGAVVGAYQHMGALRDLIYANVVFPMTEYGGINKVPYGYGLLEFAVSPSIGLFGAHSAVSGLISAGLSTIPFLVIAALPLLAGPALLASLWFGKKRLRWEPEVAVTLAGYGLWFSEAHRADIVHLVFGAPFLLIAVASCSSTMFSMRAGQVAAGIVVTSLVTFGIVNSGDRLRGIRSIATRRGTVMSAQNDQAIRFLRSSVREGEDVFVYPYAPAYYYLENVRNPTRYSLLLYGYNTPAQFDEVIKDLEKARVRYVLDAGVSDQVVRPLGLPEYHEPPAGKRKLETYLSDNYTPIDVKAGFRILERKHSMTRTGGAHTVIATGGENARTKK